MRQLEDSATTEVNKEPSKNGFLSCVRRIWNRMYFMEKRMIFYEGDGVEKMKIETRIMGLWVMTTFYER